MTSRDFCYWLQGYFEIEASAGGGPNPTAPTLAPNQVAVIRRHLDMVFKHEIDPSMGPAEHQAALSTIHNPPPAPDPAPARPPQIGGDGPGGIKMRC